MNAAGRLLLLVTLAAGIAYGSAHAQTLTVADRQSSKTYTAKELRADPAARDIAIARDPVQGGRAMTYRAVPTADLLKSLRIGADDYVQARATDDFSVGIPARLLRPAAKSDVEAFVAIEDEAAPWPALPGHPAKGSAGPFLLIWQAPASAGLSSEYWAYKLAALTVGDSPVTRWPGLAVAAGVPADDPVRRGLDRFVAVCLACHRFNGAGEGTQGPDLARPMNPVDYFTPEALRKLLRDPASVRSWPERKMPAFDAASLSDADVTAIIAWLAYKNAHRP